MARIIGNINNLEKHIKIKNDISPEQNLFSVSELLAQVSALQLKENSIVRYVGSTPLACLNCPYLQTLPNCNQCNRWNQQE